MKDSVRDCFVEFSSALEGVVPWMYLDVKGLVTVAIGNLIDTPDSAMILPFVFKGTNEPASRDAILREWSAVKAHQTAAKDGHRVLAMHTSLRLTPEGIHQLVTRKLSLNHEILESRFPDINAWPADAQLATHSMAWACGPHFDGAHRGGFPLLGSLLRSGDFAGAARQCHMNEAGNPGLIPRNKANKALYRAAADPEDPELVSWGILTAVSAAHFPARPREPSVVTPEQSMQEAAIVRPRVPLPERD